MIPLARVTAHLTDSIRNVMKTIDAGACGMAVVVDSDRRVLGTITDGDIRRAILAGADLNSSVAPIVQNPGKGAHAEPVTASIDTPAGERLRLMRSQGIRHLVLIDADDRAVGLATLEELIPFTKTRIEAVIMAGGRGRRLMPLTDELPKPMLPVGGRPMLEWIIDGLKRSGITRITIASHYKAEIIRRYFGNGWKLGVSIQHLYEDQPAGTAGALRLLPQWDSTILVINGDILTWVDFTAMAKFHAEHQADLTVAVRQHDIQVPYGVVDMVGPEIRKLSEKPTLPYYVNAGIYLLEPNLRALVADDEHVDMTDLIDRALARGRTVVGYPITEYWADIGQIQDYERARDHVDAQLSGVAS